MCPLAQNLIVNPYFTSFWIFTYSFTSDFAAEIINPKSFKIMYCLFVTCYLSVLSSESDIMSWWSAESMIFFVLVSWIPPLFWN